MIEYFTAGIAVQLLDKLEHSTPLRRAPRSRGNLLQCNNVLSALQKGKFADAADHSDNA